MSSVLNRATLGVDGRSRVSWRPVYTFIILFWALLTSFAAAAQDHVVCPGNQIKIYGWGGALWAAASPSCPGGGVFVYPSMGVWETTVRSTCLASGGAANLAWGAVRPCSDPEVGGCGLGPNGFAMELSFDHPMGYRADVLDGAGVLPQCKRGYYVAVPAADPSPKPGNPCDRCQAEKGASASVGDPADALSGNEYQASTDFVSGDGRFTFERSYNNGSNQTTSIGIRWQTEYDARIETTWNSSDSAAYASTVYDAPQQACEEGWLTIAAAAKVVWPDTDGATATYHSDTTACMLSSGRQLPLAFTGNSADYVALASKVPNYIGGYGAATVALMTARRPDGRLYRFICQDAVCEGESNASLKLILLPTAYRLDLGNGTVENYDNAGHLISIVDRDGYTRTVTWDGEHMVNVTDSSGRSIAFTYNNDLVSDAAFPDGSSAHYTYTNRYELQSVTRSDGTTVTYGYDAGITAGLLTSITDELGKSYLTIHYDAQNRAAGDFLAGNANATSITYPDADSSAVTDRFGATRTYRFTRVNGLRLLSSIDGPWCEECLGSNVSYDASGYPSAITDFKGTIKKTTYGSDGLLSQQIEAFGLPEERTIRISWDTTHRVPLTRTTSDHQGNILEKHGWEYDDGGRVTASCKLDPSVAPNYVCTATGATPAGVARTTYTYCTAADQTTCPRVGLLLAIDGPRSDVADTTSYIYYTDTDESGCTTSGGSCHRTGDLASETHGGLLTTHYLSYDKAGRLTRLREPSGVIKDYGYNARGQLASVSVRTATSGQANTNDAVTTVEYDPTGTVHKITDPDGVTTIFSYDDAHRLTDVVDTAGARIHYTLDSAGNRIGEKVTDSAGTLATGLSRTFNALGKIATLTDGLGHMRFSATFADSYDGQGNLVHSQDAMSVQHKQAYDGLNRLVSALRDYNGTNVATANTSTVLGFDVLDRVRGVTDPDGLLTTYDFDGLGNPTGLHSPDTGTTTLGFDLEGNPTSSKDAANITTSSTYDAIGRILSTSYPNSSFDIQYKYDESDAVTACTGSYGVGRLTRIIESNASLTYCYDQRGNVVTKRQTVGSATTTTQYVWTRGDRLSSVTTSNGTIIAYARNSNGQVTAVTATPSGGTNATIADHITYRPFGPVASYVLGNGTAVTRTFDANGQISDISSPAFSLHVRRDAAGNIVAIGNAAGVAQPTETYDYDPLYRLMNVKDGTGGPIETYTYNKTGDRLSKVAPGLLTGSYSYKSGTHQLIGIGTTTREVDARGNTTANVMAGSTLGFGYNQRNRLTVVQRDGVTVGSYVLNGLGQRVMKTAGGNTDRFDYTEASQLLSESTTDTARDYVWLDDLPLGIVDTHDTGTSIAFVVADVLQTPRAVTDASGATLWKWDYESNPFGEKGPISTNWYTLNLRFPGQYFDAESGLNYNVNRDYESATGRYTQSDPLGLYAGPSVYAYVSGNPLLRSDPFGLADYLEKCVGRYTVCSSNQTPNGFTPWNYVKFRFCKGVVDMGITTGDKMSSPSRPTGTINACDTERRLCLGSLDTEDPSENPDVAKCLLDSMKCQAKSGKDK